MSGLNLDALHVDFDPPLWKKPRRRRRDAIIIDKEGRLLVGIVIHYRKGELEKVEVPEALTICNQPESGGEKLPLSELDHEALRMKVRDELHHRPDPPGHPERQDAREQIRLLRKAWAASGGRRN